MVNIAEKSIFKFNKINHGCIPQMPKVINGQIPFHPSIFPIYREFCKKLVSYIISEPHINNYCITELNNINISLQN